MSRLKQGIRLQYLSMKPGFLIFWEVILAIMVVQYLLILYFTPQMAEGGINVNSVVAGHLLAVVIFMGVATGIQCWETMPYSLNLGSTRQEFWLSCALFNIMHSLVMAGILVVLSLLERGLFGALGWEHHFMGNTVNINVGTVLTWLVVDFSVIAMVAAGVFLFVFLAYRFGWKVLMVLGVGFVSGMILSPTFGQAVGSFIEYLILLAFGQENPWVGVGWLVVFSIVCYLLAYPLVKSSQVKN